MLLREAGFKFDRFDPPFADPADPNEALDPGAEASPTGAGPALAVRLAELKARSVPSDAIPPDAVLLCADTLGVAPTGGLIGTPETAEQALAMLRELVGRTHAIVTGVALRTADGAEPCSFADTATVNVGQIDETTLQTYVDTGGWRGKAGAYNLAERLGAGWPITVAGDPGTVMGLPMRRLTAQLVELGVPQAPGPDPGMTLGTAREEIAPAPGLSIQPSPGSGAGAEGGAHESP